MAGSGGRGLDLPGSKEYTLQTLSGINFVLFLIKVLSGQLKHKEERNRKNPKWKANGISDFGLVRMKKDCSEPTAGMSELVQVLKCGGEKNVI